MLHSELKTSIDQSTKDAIRDFTPLEAAQRFLELKTIQHDLIGNMNSDEGRLKYCQSFDETLEITVQFMARWAEELVRINESRKIT